MQTTPRLAIRLAYLGGAYSGWQKQANSRTVQGELEAALARLYRQPVRTVGAGRTDAGVHADGQVAHFSPPLPVPLPNLVAALNPLLPADVRVTRAWQPPAGFHALASATAKRYRYRLAWDTTLTPHEGLRRWLTPCRLDPDAMARALALVPGTHDFACFALTGHSGDGARGTVRTVRIAHPHVRGRRIDIVIEADGFLRGMVRRIVGALVEVGRGAQGHDWFAALVANAKPRPPAPTAPAHGLTLERVYY